MEKSPEYLSQLVASRLNHDYVAPMTAIANSCELIEISRDTMDDCFDLINETINSAIGLLQLYRLAFGPFHEDEEFSIKELKRHLVEIIGNNDCAVNLDIGEDTISRGDAKLLVLALLCIRSSFARINALFIAQNDQEWRFEASGTGAFDETGDERSVDNWNDTAPWKSSNVQFPLLRMHCERVGLQTVRKIEDDLLTLDVVPQFCEV